MGGKRGKTGGGWWAAALIGGGLLVGALGGGMFAVTHHREQEHPATAQATITEAETCRGLYVFAVDGREYTGEFDAQAIGTRKNPVNHRSYQVRSCDGAADEYEIGDRLQIRYDPADPTDSLYQRRAWWTWVQLVVGVAGLLVALGAAAALVPGLWGRRS